jgi:hypothetical protein
VRRGDSGGAGMRRESPRSVSVAMAWGCVWGLLRRGTVETGMLSKTSVLG